ncbi:toxin [Thermoactinomyces sp. DSM 45891]|nr:toxin [Thermoactinomyces sp. DSM 45891]
MSTLIVSNRDSDTKYNFIYTVEERYLGNAIQQAAAYDAAIDPQTNGFDLNKGLEIANRNGTLMGQIDRTIISQTIQVDSMVNQVMGVIRDFLGVNFPAGQITNELTASMQSTFTDLHTQQDSA